MQRNSSKKWGRRDVRPRFDHGEPENRIDIRPIALFAAIVAVGTLVWYVSREGTHTLLIELPAMEAPPNAIAPEYITIEVTVADEILVDGRAVQLRNLGTTIKGSANGREYVLFRPDGQASYGLSAITLDAIVDAGISRNRICFDQLEYHRNFGKDSFTRTEFVAPSEPQPWPGSLDIDSGCALILVPEPLY